MKRKTYQIIDDIKLVVFSVLRVDLTMLLFPHVISESAFVPEDLLTVQALQAEGNRQTLTDESRRLTSCCSCA